MRLEYLKEKNPAPTTPFYKKAEWHGTRILILGFGMEGRDTFRFLRKLFPKKVISIADQKQLPISNFQFSKVKLHLGKNYLKALKDYDIIIKSPGIPIHLPEIEKAFKQGKITSQTEIFLENCPGKIIGITGTKGKGTTTSLIYQIFKACPERSRKVHLIGNIGKPVLSFLLNNKRNDFFVYELSSHQLYNLKKSPQIAVFLNIFPAHLDYFKNFREYVRAKENITAWQNNQDYLIFNREDKIVRAIAKKSKAKKLSFGLKENRGVNCFLKGNYIIYFNDKKRKEKIIKISDVPLKGEFNLQNIMAAIIVAKIFGISNKKIKKAIKNFKGLPHRLEFIGKYQGILFYNDSLATIPEATISALKTLGDQVQTILLGGSDCRFSFSKLAQEILNSKVKNLILFPTTGEKIWKEILERVKGKPVLHSFFVNNMREAIRLAYKHTKKGKICLLSPAAPSFSVFRNYQERGNLFKKYVRILAKQKTLEE